MDFVNLFITFSGRINRAKFWLVAIFCFGFLVAVMGATAFFTSSVTTIFQAGIVAYIPIAYAAVVSAIKRLHDRNKSGWWVVLLYGVPTVFPGLAGVLMLRVVPAAAFEWIAMVLQLISLIVIVWALIALGCLRGTIGRNQYGPDPLTPEVLTPPVRTHA
jgi:uncharacterized membrane protein YhaH (DUF805 family)